MCSSSNDLHSFQAPSPPRRSAKGCAAVVEFSDLDGSSSLSMASSTSSCVVSSPPNSFSGLRRSTFDLSELYKGGQSGQQEQPPQRYINESSGSSSSSSSLRYRGGTSSSSSLKTTAQIPSSQGAASRALLELVAHDALSPTIMRTTRSRSQDLWYQETFGCGDGLHNNNNIRTNGSSNHNKGATTSDQSGLMEGLEALVEDLLMGYLSFLRVFLFVERKLRMLFQDMMQCLDKVLSSLSNAIQFEEPIVHTMMDMPLHDRAATPQDSLSSHSLQGNGSSLLMPRNGSTASSTMADHVRYDMLYELQRHELEMRDEAHHVPETETSAALTDEDVIIPSTNGSQQATTTKDEWGHFTDFQEELADESSFIPSCRRPAFLPEEDSRIFVATSTALETLAEITEDNEEEEDEGGWSF